jgi:hypothetical protein
LDWTTEPLGLGMPRQVSLEPLGLELRQIDSTGRTSDEVAADVARTQVDDMRHSAACRRIGAYRICR